MHNFHYFKSSLILTGIGLILAAGLGFYEHHSLQGVLSSVFLVSVLGVLEISLSFDNAVVNAKVLNQMTPKWQHRFLTWGMIIAVFGMRIVFPLLLVGVVAQINPLAALKLATFQPDEYARLMLSAHIPISAFGGSFLMMVAFKYFFDAEKDVHWLGQIEKSLAYLGRLQAIEAALVLLLIYFVSQLLHDHERATFLVSGIFGVVAFIFVDGIGAFLHPPLSDGKPKSVSDLERISVGLFIYLEVLDASFSFDGVIGAFAITNSLFIIAIGLGIGALFVRSLTIMLVERGTLTEYRYLEHGAFWAILALAVIMFMGTVQHIPEAITGLIGAAFIAVSFYSSVKFSRAQELKSS